MPENTEIKTEKRVERATGTVVSTGGTKTCHVDIENLRQHALYGKYLRRRTRLAVHDPQSQAELGDTVEITPCRPISKTKRWRLVRVIRKAVLPQSVTE